MSEGCGGNRNVLSKIAYEILIFCKMHIQDDLSIVPFEITIPEEERDTELANKIINYEL